MTGAYGKTPNCSRRNPDCRIRYAKGRGRFKGYRLVLCTRHQIVVKMKMCEDGPSKNS